MNAIYLVSSSVIPHWRVSFLHQRIKMLSSSIQAELKHVGGWQIHWQHKGWTDLLWLLSHCILFLLVLVECFYTNASQSIKLVAVHMFHLFSQ